MGVDRIVVGAVFIALLCVVRTSGMGAQMTIYPDDAYSRPPDDRLPTFEMRACSPGEGVIERASQFAVNEMELVRRNGGWSTRWRIRSNGAQVAALSAECPLIRREPRSVSFRVFNSSSKPISIKAQYGEYPWHPGSADQALAWELSDDQKVEAMTERTVEFRFADARWPDRQTPAKPRYPGVMRLYVVGLEKGADYELFLNDYTFHYPPAPDMRASRIECPPVLRPGQAADFDVAASPTGPTGQTRPTGPTDLEIRREPWTIWRIRLTPAEVADLSKGLCRVRRTVPFYLSAGPAEVCLVADGYRAEGPTARVKVKNDSQAELPEAERRLYHGRPTLFVNGKPFSWTGYQSPDFQPGNAGDFGSSGARVLTIQCDLGRLCPKPGTYDYGSVDEQVGTALAANPNAMIFLAINLRLPPVWDQTHRDDLVRIATESGTLVWEEGLGNRVGSLASEGWYRDQEIELRKLLRYCKSQPWAGRMLGMWLMGEVTAEWFAWGCNDRQFADYSAPNEARFAKWAEEHGISAESIPPPQVRNQSGCDFYPDTTECRAAAAYNQYYADLTAETIRRLARAAKDETGGRSITAVFFGYVIQLAGEFRGPIGGNFALERVLADPNVDVIGGVPLHNFRDFLNGYSVYISATESILAAGKVYCDSNDLFSWLHPLHWYREYDPQDPRKGAIQMQRRETANNAVHGAANEWFSLMSSWHHDAGLHADLARQNRVMQESLSFDRTPTEQIAFVVDGSTFAWSCPQSEYLRRTNTDLLFSCGRTGAPVGVWLLSDLDRLPERIKFVVIACANAAKPEDIAKLHRLVERGGRTILVVGAPGLIDPIKGVRQPRAVSDLLGLPIEIEGSSTPKCERTERPLSNGGRLIWRDVPPLSAALMRQWAQEAGVHFYAPQEYFVYSSRELVSFTSPRAEQVKLNWPKGVTIRDLFDGWQGSGEQIVCPFDAGQTRLFSVRDKR